MGNFLKTVLFVYDAGELESRLENVERVRGGSFVFYENRFAHETKSVLQFCFVFKNLFLL